MRSGIAQRVDLPHLATPKFKETLAEMLKNPRYYETAQKKGQLMRDQPEKPIERAMWWVEYVLRNKDISHLKNEQLLRMNFVVKHSIDVILIYGAVGALLLYIFCKVVKCLFGRSKPTDKKKVKKH